MEAIEVKNVEQKDERDSGARKKSKNARAAYYASFWKTPKKVDRAELNRTDSGRAAVTFTNQYAKEAFVENKHKLFSTCQKDTCKDMSSKEDGPQAVKNSLVDVEVNDDVEKAVQENLRRPKLVTSIQHGRVLDCDNSLEMDQEVLMPSKGKGHNFVASPIMPSKDICTSTGAETLLTAGFKRKDCSKSCETCSNKQRSCHGKGCQRSYRPSCSELPLEDFHLGVWYCPLCVRKKIESGVHSVSEGIEAIWDSSESEASEDGLRGQKQYFVKYKGLAHVHNLWIPENQVLLEAPSLVTKYKRRNQGSVWKQHWAVPHRLLQKRLLTTKECGEHHCNGPDGDKLNCHVQWLVKWCGLGYEHASWELENASFLRCPESQSLIRDYETRHKKAKRDSKLYKELAPDRAVSSGIDTNIDAENKLSNCLTERQNAVIFYDQERIPNVISFIRSFSTDKSRPFLIISTSTLLNLWDDEFLRLAPSTDVVVYSGSKEIRNSIRNLEFYEEGGCIMFQVLITSPEVVCQDLNFLECIGWEVIIVDECQRPRIASCFEQIKMLTASKRLLIINSQLKDNVVEYIDVLSLLDSQNDSNVSDSLLTNSSDNIGILKERLAKYVAYESSRFVEYWVPVHLSSPQLEQYCFNLLWNSLSLCSPSKIDPVGALCSILIFSRKCCDHPYVVDEYLQRSLTKGLKEVEFLDVGIKASGKLQLLDAMLSEIKKRELKVLVLFQKICDSGKDLMGDILDDVLRQRFGPDSYERLDHGVTSSKKQSALNKFNNERERFVFLLETRACLPSIKLSAISTVIIFGSDWSPMNDLRALQRITLDSQFEEIKVFRLYSSFTVEEKILMLSKQDKILYSNIMNISRSCSHTLLKWGASYLFSQLEKFHGISTLDASTLPEHSLLEDVIQEFSILLHQTCIENDASKLSLILKAKQIQGMYRAEKPLFGEQKMQVINEDPPHMFWTKLLEGKSPRWKYCSSFQRNRKRVQYNNGLEKKSQAESIEVVKRRKVVNDGNDHPSPKPALQEDKEGISAYGLCPSTSSPIDLAKNISLTPSPNMVEWERRIEQCDSQKNLPVLLRPQIEKLCEVLHLSEDAKALAGRFLEYFMNNHLINRELETILQPFQISLCWCAASLSKQKIDHKDSLALAKQHLGFTCKKEEADYIYSMLRCLNRMFLYRTGYLKVPNSSKSCELSSKAVGRDFSNVTSYQQNVKAKAEDLLGFQVASDAQVIADSGPFPEFQLAQMDLVKSIKEIEKRFNKKMSKLTEKQKQAMKQSKQNYEEEKAHLENKKRTEAAVIRLHSNDLTRTDKINKLDIEYARKFDELKQRLDLDLKDLEASQVAERNDVLERKTCWVQSVKSWARVELVMPPVSEAKLSKERSSACVIQSAPGTEVRLSKIVPDKVMACNDPIDTAEPCKENSKVASVEEGNKTVCSVGGEEQATYKDSSPQELVSVGDILDGGAQVHVPPTVSSGDVTESVLSLRCSDEDQISDESKLNMSNGNPETVSPADPPENSVSIEALSCDEIPNGSPSVKPNREVPLKAAESISFCKGQNNLISLQGPSSEKSSDIDTLRKVDGETPLEESGIVISGGGRENLVSLEAMISVGIPDGPNSSKLDGQVLLKETLVVYSNEGQENHVSAEAPSSEENPDGAALGKDVGDIHLRTTQRVNFGGDLENSVSLEAPLSGKIADGTTLSNLDGEVQLRAAETVNSGKVHENLQSVVAPLSEKISTWTTLGMAAGELPLSAHEEVSSSEGQGNVMLANSSSEKQIPCGDTVSVPDREVPKSTSEIATSCDGMNGIVGTNPSTSIEPGGIPDTAEFETAPTEVFEGGSTHIENDGTSAIEIDQQDGLLCSMNLEPELQKQSLADLSSLHPVPTSDQNGPAPSDLVPEFAGSLPSASPGTQASDVANDEMRNASRLAETLPSNGSIDVTCNVSSPGTPVVELRAQMQHLRSTESISNLSLPDLPSVSATEHQPSNDGQNANQISQDPRQPMTNSVELLNQDFLQPLHSPINSTTGGDLRRVSETSTISVPSVSRGLPLQTAPPVSSRMALPSYNDPLKNEIVRICQEKDQTIKFHEDTKLQLKMECEKEIVEVVAKYEAKLQEKETEFLLQKKKLDVSFNQALLNEILADVFRSDFMDNRASGSAGSQQGANSSFMQQLLQASSQQTEHQPSSASGLRSTGSATSSQTVSPAVVNTQTMSPSSQVVYPSGFFSGTPARSPHISSITLAPGSHQVGGEIRAPAPHLQTFRPLAPSSLLFQFRGMSSQLTHNFALRQPSIMGQAGRIQHEVAGGLAALPNSFYPSLDVLVGMDKHLSGANANLPSNLLPGVSSSLVTSVHRESHAPSIQPNPTQQSGGATDIVYQMKTNHNR